MGGCRCIFRDCDVSTARYPNMHFFRFPANDATRLLEWAQLAGVEHIVKMTLAQQKNRVICARHFRDKHFMNYKKDRIHKTAAVKPTITRVSKSLAFDYENVAEGAEPKLIKLDPPTMPHLIPPVDFSCPLELPDDDVELLTTLENCEASNEHDNGKTMEAKNNSPANNETQSPISRAVRKKPKVIHAIVADKKAPIPCNDLNQELAKHDFAQEHTVLSPPRKIKKIWPKTKVINTYASPQRRQIGLVSTATTNTILLQSNDDDSSASNTNGNIIEIYSLDDLDAFDNADLNSEENASADEPAPSLPQLEVELATANQLVDELRAKLSTASAANSQWRKMYELLQAKYKEETQQLKDDHAAMLSRLVSAEAQADDLRQKQQLEQQQEHRSKQLAEEQRQQESTISTSNTQCCSCKCLDSPGGNGQPIAPAAAAPSAVAPPLSKVQLFNGIKRYLSASMVALMRMEMFGNAERQWKADEERVSVDLLRLGENVYQYFADEWRVRLPTLREARIWLNKHNHDDDNEEEL